MRICMRLHAPESWCVVYFPSTVKMYVLFLCVSGNNFIQIQKRMRRREREKKKDICISWHRDKSSFYLSLVLVSVILFFVVLHFYFQEGILKASGGLRMVPHSQTLLDSFFVLQ